MNNLFQQRKDIVRAILRGLKSEYEHLCNKRDQPGFQYDGHHAHHQVDTCVITGLTFADHMAEMVVGWSDYGPVWLGLWLDEPVKLDDDEGGDGNILFPRWLAEALNEEYDMGITEDNIYNSSFDQDGSYQPDGAFKASSVV